MSEYYFLGLDASTQGLKASVMDASLQVVHRHAVNFDRDLPAFETNGGVHRHPDGVTVTAPPRMWVAALDRLLDALRREGPDLSRVAAIAGSGQQHGSVWLRAGARERLRGLRATHDLSRQLADIFSLEASPIWMDAGTTAQCREREARLGGAQAVADVTGSRAYERFTGNQIAKVFQTTPERYAHTERIALVSSFMASLLIGDYAPIDLSDGSGMNLLDIRRRTWDAAALAVTAPGLDPRLGNPVPAHAVVGRVHAYYVARYGFDAMCRVIAFSGDNPNSLAGLRLQAPGDVAVSLGTSDTCFGSLCDPCPSGEEGHVLISPVDPDLFMAMIVYQNGSRTRERIRDHLAGGSWERFNALVDATPPGNAGRIGIYVDDPEITPPLRVTGAYRWNPDGSRVAAFEEAAEARAVLEGRCLSILSHGKRIGLAPTRVLATGGASANPVILRVLADVLGVPVFTADASDSAALGAAYRALHGWACAELRHEVAYGEVIAGAPPLTRAIEPDAGAHEVYRGMLAHYEACERQAAEPQ